MQDVAVREYIEKTLHIKARLLGSVDTGGLPLYLKAGYDLQLIELAGMACLFAAPRDGRNLVALRKQREQLMKHFETECVLYFKEVGNYAQKKMVEEKIPFVVEEKQIYLPFLGVALSKQRERPLTARTITFATQRLLLNALYRRWRKVSQAEVAAEVGVSAMTVTRCFDELEAMKLPLLQKNGRRRYFAWEQGNRSLWEQIRPVLRNPIAREYRLDADPVWGRMKLGGISAVCHYSMLADNPYVTYAVSREQEQQMGFGTMPRTPYGEIPALILQVLRYEVPYPDDNAIDPITAILSLSEEDVSDPRVGAMVGKILEERVYDQRA